MSVNKKKLLSKVSAVSASLDELEAKLDPLFSQPLQDTVASLDTLQQAKMQVVLPYLINDLIFIYLRTRGVDPKTHPVVAELDRVRQYFSKIKDAEDAGKKKTTGIDKAAAGRFIKHAISQARQGADAAATTGRSEAELPQPSTSAYLPVRVTEKMREREKYQQELAEDSNNEEEVLEVIVDADEDDEPSDGKGKGVAPAQFKGTQERAGSSNTKSGMKEKRQRPMDPFGSFGDDPLAENGVNVPAPQKKSKKLASVIDGDVASSGRASLVDNNVVQVKVAKKRKTKKAGA
ncbi:C1D-domain-containing protein [Phellopilus nigrolimitatus]|nr:C1D-domain-containing protein [Phellopilus nigrolimitatus]